MAVVPKGILLALALVVSASAATGAEGDPPVYAVIVVPDGIRPPRCRFTITYPAGPRMTKFSIVEKADRGMFGVWALTYDPTMFNKEIHLVIDGRDIASVRVGSGVTGSNPAGGLAWRYSTAGRDEVHTITRAAQDATSVKFVVPGREVDLPVEGLREATREFEACRTIRWM